MFGAGPCLYESGLIPKKLTYREDAELVNYGIGITNIVPRTTRAANELSRLVIGIDYGYSGDLWLLTYEFCSLIYPWEMLAMTCWREVAISQGDVSYDMLEREVAISQGDVSYDTLERGSHISGRC